MLFDRSPQTRRAFTLIELLTVVVIIGILAGLVTAAAIRVRASVRKASHAIELKELEMALHAYKDRFGEFPPDCEGANAATLFRRHVRKAWPRCTSVDIDAAWNTYGQYLDASTALTFWLGGVPEIVEVDGQFHVSYFDGFSSNPADPFAQGGTRILPFYEFDTDRVAVVNRLQRRTSYYPTVESKAIQPAHPIRYYRAENGSYGNKPTKIPFMERRVENAPPTWINPRSFQVLSPGLTNGVYAVSGTDSQNPRFPLGDNYRLEHLEMMSNFTGGTMEDAMP